MKVKTLKGKSAEIIQKEILKIISEDFVPTLAIVFSSIKQDFIGLTAFLDKRNISVFGATTGGEFIDGDFDRESMAVMLLDVKSELFSLFYEAEAENDTRKKAQMLAKQALKKFMNPAFIVAGSGLRVDGEFVIRGIEDAAGKDTTIYGALAADDLQMQETLVFTNNKSSNQGIVLIAFDGDRIEFKGRATHGVKGVGTMKTITSSDGWWIHTIDDEPALDLVARYMGLNLEKTKNISPIPPEYTTTYPMVMHRKKGDPIIRPVLMFNYETGSVMSNGTVEQGAKVQLSVPPDFEIIEEVKNDCKEVKNNELPEADGVIIFSCVGRLSALGPLISDEINGIKETFNVPTVGFFSYGEFGRATNGNHEYHNLTCCWVALKEKEL